MSSTLRRERPSRTRAARVAASGLVIGLVAGVVAVSAGGPASAADTQLSNSSGRFLSGSVGGTSFDTVAGIEGESASYPASPGPNKNSLNAELLNKAITLPFGSSGLQLPDPTGGAVQLGAVAQYAQANKDGSAISASGAVDSNGGLGVAGSDGVPTGGATIDLSGSKALSAVTTQVADIKLTIGAVSARAQQVALGKKIADPSATCTSGGYQRISDADQAGQYGIAGLSLDLTSPLIAKIGSTLTSTLNTVLTTANVGSVLSTLGSTPLGSVVTVGGLPTDPSSILDGLLTLSLANGSITINLETGALHVDLAALLKFLGLDINTLCPNTSLLPYIVKALTSELPKALQALVTEIDAKIATLVGGITLTVLDQSVPVSTLTNLAASLTSTLTGAVGSVLNAVDTSALDPLLQILSNNLLNLIANGQDESDTVLTQTGLQLNLLPGGGSAGLPTIPGLPTLPGVPSTSAAQTQQARFSTAQRQYQQQHPNAQRSTADLSRQSTPAVKADAVRSAALSPAAASSATVVVNLAQATVGPNAAVATPTPTTPVPTTKVPTGVPAGQGAGGGSTPTTPLVLVLISLGLAAGGVTAYRLRGARGSH